MSRLELPQGISPTNDKPSFAAPALQAAPHRALRPNAIPQQLDFVESVVSEEFRHGDDGGALPKGNMKLRAMIAMIATAGLLTALAVVIIANDRSPTPLCSELPEWNQHNCRSG